MPHAVLHPGRLPLNPGGLAPSFPPASQQRLRSDSFLILEFGKGDSECCPTAALQLYDPA